jgi:hypothetical protein
LPDPPRCGLHYLATQIHQCPSPLLLWICLFECVFVALLICHTLLVMLLGDSLKLPIVCFVCNIDLLRARFTAHCPLSGLSLCPPKMSSNTTFSVGFWPTRDPLPSGCRYSLSVILQFLFCVYFYFSPFISCMLLFPFFFCLLVIRLCPLSICMCDALWVICYSLDLWIVDVNIILTFGSMRKSFGWRFVYPQFRGISTTYMH